MSQPTKKGQAPPGAQVLFVSIPLAASPWVVLTLTSPSAFAFNVGMSIAAAVFALLLIWAMLWSPEAQKTPGLVAAHVVAGVTAIEGCFALGYYLMSARVPTAFSAQLDKVGAAYFSVSTATTTGMGDIHPVTDAARLVVTAQMAGSVFLVVTALGTALARLLKTQ